MAVKRGVLYKVFAKTAQVQGFCGSGKTQVFLTAGIVRGPQNRWLAGGPVSLAGCRTSDQTEGTEGGVVLNSDKIHRDYTRRILDGKNRGVLDARAKFCADTLR